MRDDDTHRSDCAPVQARAAALRSVPVAVAAVACSTLAHAAVLFAVLLHDGAARTSLGVQVATVDIVLGLDSAAGLARSRGEAPEPAAPARPLVPLPTFAEAALEVNPARALQVLEERGAVLRAERARTAIADAIAPPATVAERPQPIAAAAANSAPPAPAQSPRPARPARQDPRPQRSAAAEAAGGAGRGRSDAESTYPGQLVAHLARHQRFPAEARQRGEEGTSTVSFRIDGGGRLLAVALARSSGIPSIDREVLALIARAAPFPPPPGGRTLSVTVPVTFRLK